MSGTFPAQASSLRKNGHVMLNDQPCKIINMTTAKTGKHGHAKITFTGVNIFTGDKIIAVQGSTHNMDVPNVQKCEYSLTDIDDEGYLILMTDTGELKEDLKLPDDELGIELQSAFQNLPETKQALVIIQSACDQEKLISYKLSKI